MKICAEQRRGPLAVALTALVTLAAGCGGGGGGATTATASIALAAAVPAPAAGSGNVLSIAVGPANKVNLAMASLTVCVPGSAACRTIDRVLIDTGSTGLRLAASALAGLALPAAQAEGGGAIAQCAQFAHGYTWGAVSTADVRIAGESAASLPIQVIGDAALPPAPAACASTGRAMDLAQDLGVNGVLGLGAFRRDCGVACEQSAHVGIYYVCDAGGCRGSAVPRARQVANPVGLFARNNNGIVVQLPAVPASGAPGVEGTLVFGIGTQDNNAIGSASVYALSPLTGCLVTYYKGQTYDHSFFDTGSNALFFNDDTLPTCASGSGFFCAPSPLSLTATVQGGNGANTNVSFAVGHADALIATGATAFHNLGAPVWSALTFDWGLPFFYGRRVYVALEGAAVPGAAQGPFVAF